MDRLERRAVSLADPLLERRDHLGLLCGGGRRQSAGVVRGDPGERDQRDDHGENDQQQDAADQLTAPRQAFCPW